MKKRPLCYVCLVFLLIKSVLLLLTGGQSGGLSADSIFQEEKEKEVILQGQVYQKTSTSKMQILYLKNNSINSQNESFYESKIIVYDKTFQNIAIGKTVKLRGKANVFETAHNPGNFDQRQYYAKQNIYGMVWGEQIMEVSGKTNRLMNSLYSLKQAWKEKLTEMMGEKNGAILSAILLSEKKEMDAEIKELYQKNGIGHVLAISGLHISFIGLSVYQIFRKVGSPYFVAGIGSGTLLFLYVLMIGFSVSVIRAAIMLLLRIGADMTGRVYDMATALFFAGAVTVLWQPLYLADAGFLLSYGAILGILTILPAIEKLFPCKYQVVKGIYASIGINLILFPVLLYFYFEFPIYSLLLNMAVIPMMSWVLGLGLIGSLFLPICQPIGIVLVKVCGILLELFEWMSRFTSRLPGARMVFGQPSWWQISVYYLLVFGSVIFVLKCKKKEALRLLRKSVAIEQQKQENAYTNSRVGQVKDRTEKDELFSTPDRHPIRQNRLYQREIKHIDHLSVQPAGITSAFRHKGRHLTEAMIEHHAIKNGVDNIPDRTREDQRDTSDKTERVTLFHQLIEIISDKTDRHDTKYRQKQLPDYLYPERHPRILRKVQIEPRSDLDTLMQLHVSLNPYFKSLVKNKEQHYD